MADARPVRDTAGVSDEPPSDAVLEALWQRAIEAWADERAHAALLEHAMGSGALPEIASRYRRLADDPDKGPGAEKRLERIVVAATQMLLATKMPRPGKTPLSITLSAVAVCLLLMAWLAFALWGRR
jgi:hypothetical protein